MSCVRLSWVRFGRLGLVSLVGFGEWVRFG